MTIIILAFIPVFALTGREGKLFHPLAFTKTFAMVGATIIAVTLVPVLCTLLLGGRFHSEEDNIVMRALHAIYRPALRLALAHRVITILLAAALFGGALYLATRIGNEFMPELNEGDLMYMPITDPAISIDEALRVMQMQDRTLKSFPEVEWVVGKAGRAETSTDPAPVNMNETIIHLKPPRSMASRNDARKTDRRDGREACDARCAEHLDAADHQPHRDADDRHPHRDRRQDIRQ